MKLNKFSREWPFRIKDILQAIEKIELYTNGMTISEFKKNELVQDAVIRNFEIIGEAAKSVPINIQKTHMHIPWRQIIAFRNFLIHEYSGVDLITIWQTIINDLLHLKQQMLSIIVLDH